MDMVKVNGKEVMVVEYHNQRVLLTEQVAQTYECKTIQIQQNYANHKYRFVEGKHFFKLEGEELKQFKASLGDSTLSSKLKFASSIVLCESHALAWWLEKYNTSKWSLPKHLKNDYGNDWEIKKGHRHNWLPTPRYYICAQEEK